MSLHKVTAGTKSAPVPAGVTPGRCYCIADLGTPTEAFGTFEPRRKVCLIFELPEHRIQLERDGKQVDLPKAISARYTLSLGDKANLRHVLEAWRGRPFTPEELKGFDLEKVLGAPGLLNIVHKPRKDGSGSVAVIASISPLPKGLKCPPQENPKVWFDLDEALAGNDCVFPPGLPQWCEDEIKKSEEFTKWRDGADTPATPAPDEEADAIAAEIDAAKDDIQF
jgi:hypothetical protein